MHIHIPYTWAMDGKFVYKLYISGFHHELWRMIINEQVITYTYTCRVVQAQLSGIIDFPMLELVELHHTDTRYDFPQEGTLISA